MLSELQAALFLLPFASARLDVPWHPEVFMVDSCVQGAGLIVTHATQEEVLEEA